VQYLIVFARTLGELEKKLNKLAETHVVQLVPGGITVLPTEQIPSQTFGTYPADTQALTVIGAYCREVIAIKHPSEHLEAGETGFRI
jgi:hypothetical protein